MKSLVIWILVLVLPMAIAFGAFLFGYVSRNWAITAAAAGVGLAVFSRVFVAVKSTSGKEVTEEQEIDK